VRAGTRSRIEHERQRRDRVRVALDAWDRDRLLGGPLLAGGVAYRVFLWQLPAALLMVGLLGLAADAGAEPPADVIRRAGLSVAVADVVVLVLLDRDDLVAVLLLDRLIVLELDRVGDGVVGRAVPRGRDPTRAESDRNCQDCELSDSHVHDPCPFLDAVVRGSPPRVSRR